MAAAAAAAAKFTRESLGAFVIKERGRNSDTIHLQEELNLEKEFRPHNRMETEKSEQLGDKLESSACEEALKKERRLVESLRREIYNKDRELESQKRLTSKYEEKFANCQKVVNGLTEKINIKDKEMEEMQRKHQSQMNMMDEAAKRIEMQMAETITMLQAQNWQLNYAVAWNYALLESFNSQKHLEFGKLENEINELQAKFQNATANNISNLESQIAHLKTELKGKSKAFRNLKSLNSTLVDKALETRQELQKAHNESIALKTDLEERCDFLVGINNALTVQESYSREELQAARSESITSLKDLFSNRSTLVFRRLGEIDRKALKEACSKKFPDDDWEEISAKLCSLWEENLRDGNWHPFKIVDRNDKLEEIVNEDDERLKKLRDEYGEAVYKAVENALLEMNEHNPSGRYPVSEIWNSREGRLATMKEIVQYLVNQVKNRKRKR